MGIPHLPARPPPGGGGEPPGGPPPPGGGGGSLQGAPPLVGGGDPPCPPPHGGIPPPHGGDPPRGGDPRLMGDIPRSMYFKGFHIPARRLIYCPWVDCLMCDLTYFIWTIRRCWQCFLLNLRFRVRGGGRALLLDSRWWELHTYMHLIHGKPHRRYIHTSSRRSPPSPPRT